MADFDSLMTPQHGTPVPRRSFRWSYVLMGVSAGVFLICGGCCLLLPYFVGAQRFEGDSGVNKVASEIVDWKLPAMFEGEFGMSCDNSLIRFSIAKFRHTKGRGSLVIAKSQLKFWQPPEGKDAVNKKNVDLVAFVERVVPEFHKIDADKKITRSATVRNLPGEFEVCHGEDRASTTKYHQVIGNFHENNTDVYIIMECDDEFLTEQEIDDFLNSIL